MSSEQALEDFFWSLKLALKNVAIYPTDHPTLLSSIQELKEKINILLDYHHPLRLAFTSRAVVMGEKFLDKDKAHQEIARTFHLQKVKSLEFRRGITEDELLAFIRKIHLSPKEIIKAGGWESVFRPENFSHLAVEELDYSLLLRGEGEEIKDIWMYLLQEAVEYADSRKIAEVTGTFSRVIGELTAEDFFKDDVLQENLNKLFNYLKEKEEEKFRHCARELAKSFIKNKNIVQEAGIEKLSPLFQGLNEEDLARVLFEEMATDEKFQALNFEAFLRLTAKENHEKIAGSLLNLLQGEEKTHEIPRLRTKIKEILAGGSYPFLSEIYRQTLGALVEEDFEGREIRLDIPHLMRNFRFLILDLLLEERDKSRMNLYLEKILSQWNKIVEERDFEFLKYLLEILERRRGDLTSEPLFIDIYQNLVDFSERFFLEGNIPPDFDYFLSRMDKSLLGIKAYLNKIFKEKKVSAAVLRLFFNFFPEAVSIFRQNIRDKSADREFLKDIVKALKALDTSLSLDLLKYIYSLGDDSVKIEVLKAMQKHVLFDEDFLFHQLRKGNFALKKEALIILKRSEISKHRAVDLLFSIPSPFGIKNSLLLENVRLVEETRLKESRSYLVSLSRKKSFWNKKLREEAFRVLEALSE